MSNTTPGPDEERVPESGLPPTPDAAPEPIEPEPVEPAPDAAEPADAELAEPAPDAAEPPASETVTAAYASPDQPQPTWASEPPAAEPGVASEPPASEPPASEPPASEPPASEPEAAPAEDSEPDDGRGMATAAAAPLTPVYVTAPTPPKAKGNRGAGILIAVLAGIAYAIVYAAVALGWFALNFTGDDVLKQFESYVTSWAFWVPVAVFFLALVLLIAIVNRGGWWAYVLGGFIVGVIVYFAYIGGALLQVQAWNLTPEQAGRLIDQLWTNPLTLGAAIVAREATVWFGAWIAARGKRVRQRNLDAQRDFDREVADGPLGQRPASSWSER